MITKSKRLCVITMIGPIDILGDLVGELTDASDWVEVEHPCTLQMQPPNNLVINNMLRNSPVITGKSIMLNKRAIMWISEPKQQLLSPYQAQRSGILIAHPKAEVVNG